MGAHLLMNAILRSVQREREIVQGSLGGGASGVERRKRGGDAEPACRYSGGGGGGSQGTLSVND